MDPVEKDDGETVGKGVRKCTEQERILTRGQRHGLESGTGSHLESESEF